MGVKRRSAGRRPRRRFAGRPDHQPRSRQSDLPSRRSVPAGRRGPDRLQPQHGDPVRADLAAHRRASAGLFRELPRRPRSRPLMPFIPVLAEASANIQYKLARLQSLTEWWHWMVLLALALAIGGFVVWMYRKDSVE